MKCIICNKMLRIGSKYEMCSNCQCRGLGQLIRAGIIDLEELKGIIKK